MSTLEQERALLLDRDLEKKLSRLYHNAPVENWVEAANALSYRSLAYRALEVSGKGLELYPTDTRLWIINIQASAISPTALKSCLKRLRDCTESVPEKQALIALVEYYLEDDAGGMARLDSVPEKERGHAFFEVYAYYAVANREYEKAVEALKRAKRLSGNEFRILYHLGNSFYSLGNTGEALRWLYRVVARERNYVQAWNVLCRIYLREGDPILARQCFGMAMSVNPRDWGIYFTYADHYLVEGRFAMARSLMQEVLDLNPREVIGAEVHNYLGYIFFVEGRYDEALPAFNEALSLNPSLAVAWLNIGNIHFHRKEMSKARSCYSNALKIDPNLGVAHTRTGLSYLEEGEVSKAAPHLERGLAADPSDYWAHLGLSEYYRRSRNPAAALDEARAAMRIAPDSASVYNYLGIALETNRRYVKASKAYRKALELDPGYRWAANNLGYLYEKMIKIDPSYREAAIEAWKTRLRICKETGSSVRGAINHLKKLGVPLKTILRLTGDSPAGKRN